MRINKTKFMFALLAGLSFSASYAAEKPIMPGVTMEFNLAPKERQEFTNFSFQTVNASCVISSSDVDGDDIFVEVLRKKGKINDLPVSAGDSVMVHVRDQETLKLSGEAGGKVALTNYGLHSVKAHCATT